MRPCVYVCVCVCVRARVHECDQSEFRSGWVAEVGKESTGPCGAVEVRNFPLEDGQEEPLLKHTYSSEQAHMLIGD